MLITLTTNGKTYRVAIVTGANKGIGYSLMSRLVKYTPQFTLILTSRDETLGKEAVDSLIKLEPRCKDSLHYDALDITKKRFKIEI